jgi:hypothetical protein
MRILVAVIIVVGLGTVWFFVGYGVAKDRYKCDEVGGTSSTYNGHTTAIQLCRVNAK